MATNFEAKSAKPAVLYPTFNHRIEVPKLMKLEMRGKA